MEILRSSLYWPQRRKYLESLMKSGKDSLPGEIEHCVRMRGLFGVCRNFNSKILSAAGICYWVKMSKFSYIITLYYKIIMSNAI